jgi:hypothetical protein
MDYTIPYDPMGRGGLKTSTTVTDEGVKAVVFRHG